MHSAVLIGTRNESLYRPVDARIDARIQQSGTGMGLRSIRIKSLLHGKKGIGTVTRKPG